MIGLIKASSKNSPPARRLPAINRKSKIRQSRSDEHLDHLEEPEEKRTSSPDCYLEDLKDRPASPEEIVSWFYGLKKPLNPKAIVSDLSEFLTSLELKEIPSFREIYTIGISANKTEEFNDREGFYRAQPGDHIAYRYDVICLLGEGAFACVYKVYDLKNNRELAIKIVRQKFIEQGKYEVHMLKHLKKIDLQDNNHILHMEDSFSFRGHLCMVFELLGPNLYDFCSNEGFPLDIVRSIAHQLLLALKLLYKQGILHCDLKPENILVSDIDTTSVKLIDFGSACFRQDRTSVYIQSRYYRAPEIVLRTGYSMPIDMWSFACILFELYTGLPLFPSTSSEDLIERITAVLGAPPKLISGKTSPRIRSRLVEGKAKKKEIAKILGPVDGNFLDLLDKCLRWNPAERLTPIQALQHPFIRNS